MLGEDASTVRVHVKDAPLPFDQLGLEAELSTNHGRQTGGLRLVVSTNTISDSHVHFSSLCSRQRATYPLCMKRAGHGAVR
jgi:hypothetical protein